MTTEFGKRKDKKRLFFPALGLLGFVWIPFSIFMVVVALENLDMERAGFTALFILVLLYMVVNHLQKLYAYPHVIVEGNIMVVTEPFAKQRVYSLDKITKVYKFQKSIIFVHMGWPAMVTLNKLSLDQIEELKGMLMS